MVLHLHKSLSGGLHYLVANEKLGLAFIPVLMAAFVFAEPLLAFAGGAGTRPTLLCCADGASCMCLFTSLSPSVFWSGPCNSIAVFFTAIC